MNLSNIFISILNMSITAGFIAIAVMVARLLLKKSPKIFSYALWSVVLFRLIVPFSFPSEWSLLELIRPSFEETESSVLSLPSTPQYFAKEINTKAFSLKDSDGNKVDYPTDTPSSNNPLEAKNPLDNSRESNAPDANSLLPAKAIYKNDNSEQLWIKIGSWIWLTGVLVFLAYTLWSYLSLKRKVSTATLVFGNIYESDLILSPFILGIIKPKIYLPLNLTDQEREYILCHEQTHLSRYDHLIKPIAYSALILHWFNPLIWLSFFLMNKDMEMACDEKVLKIFTSDKEMRESHHDLISYSESLLSLATKPSFLYAPLAFGESSVKARIKNILHYKRPSLKILIPSFIIVIFLFVVLLSNPISGYSLYDHPEIQLRAQIVNTAEKIVIYDHINKQHYVAVTPDEIEKINKIVNGIRISKKSVSLSDEDLELNDFYPDDYPYSINYYRYLNNPYHILSINLSTPGLTTDYRSNDHLYRLMNKKKIFAQLEQIFAEMDTPVARDINSYHVGDLIRNKTLYVGDHIKTETLNNLLPLPNGIGRDILSLSTEKAPYGATYHYFLYDSFKPSEEQFWVNSALLFALIDNVDEISHIFHHHNDIESYYTFTRSQIEEMLGFDVRIYADSEEKLSELIDQLISVVSNNNWKKEDPVTLKVALFSLTDYDYTSVGTPGIDNPTRDDFRKLKIDLLVQGVDNRKISFPDIGELARAFSPDVFWSGGGSSQNNVDEDFAIYQLHATLFTRELDEEELRDKLNRLETRISYTDNQGKKVNIRYKFGDLLKIYD